MTSLRYSYGPYIEKEEGQYLCRVVLLKHMKTFLDSPLDIICNVFFSYFLHAHVL